MAAPLALLAVLLSLPAASFAGEQAVAPGAAAAFIPEPGRPATPADSGQARAVSPKSQLAAYVQAILKDLDPHASARFLGDRAFQAWLRQQDPDALPSLFQAAATLDDLWGQLLSHSEAETLRLSLLSRAHVRLAAEPAKLLAWAAKYGPLAKPALDQAPVREAVWEWDTLLDGQRQWLEGRKVGRDGWQGLPLPKRRETLAKLSTELFNELMAAAPKTREEMQALQPKLDLALPALSDEQRVALGERIQQVRAAVSGLADARERMAKLDDPELKAMLDSASKAGSVEETLAQLGRIFDKMGVVNRTVQANAPPRDDQKFTDEDRRLVAEMMREALLREVAGTTGGDKVVEFYKTHEFKLVVNKAEANTIGFYKPATKVMTFNETFIVEYLKSGNHSVAGLKTDKAVFSALIMQLAPLFVHEATHQRQDAWADEHGIPFWPGQHVEVEAMSVESLYILEKAAQSPAYRQFLTEAQGYSLLAREAASKAERIRRDYREFQNSIIMYHYPELPSLSGIAAWQLGYYESLRDPVRGELQRRARLSEAERRRLDDAGADKFPEGAVDPGDLPKVLAGVKSRLLKEADEEITAVMSLTPQAYAMVRGRHEAALGEVEGRLAALASPPDKPAPAAGRPGRAEPPPPAPAKPR